MPRRLTNSEAIDMIETVFESSVDSATIGRVEATVGDMDLGRAKQDVESYLAMIPADIDPDTIHMTPDVLDDSDVDCVHIIIRTEG